MSDIELYSLLVTLFFVATCLMYIGHKVKTVREQRQRKVIEASQFIADQLTDKLGSICPGIAFSPPHIASVAAKNARVLALINAAHFEQAVKYLLDSYINSFLESFKNYPFEPRILEVDRTSLGASSFWLREQANRVTKNGQKPSDWGERRHIVFSRDGGCCQRCGRPLQLSTCHIHHLLRRSSGGIIWLLFAKIVTV
ncbi:MAG: HNH endonuclease signature motif containing protein [Thermodesulfobacteriota bacterium]|nr:HNH endonuclease signature motif containing protein [Thermodesulfobacteriota bacterium]